MKSLLVQKVSWNNDVQVVPGTPLLFTVTIENRGDEAVASPLTVEICVDTKPIKTLTYNEVIAVGETVSVVSDANDAWAAAKGDHMITARIDPSLSEPRVGRAWHARSANLRVAWDKLPVPPFAAEKGYTVLTFSEDFDSMDTVDTEATGEEGYKWYVTRPWGEKDLEAEADYTIKDSVMILKNRDTWWNYGLCTIDTRRPVGYAFNKGYIEYRLRMKATADPGYVTKIRIPAVWSLPTTSIWGDALKKRHHCSVELDWMEIWGNKYADTDFFSVALHEKDHLEGKPQEEQPQPVVSTGGSIYGSGLGDYQWHVLAMQWSEGLLYTYLDGRMIHKQTYCADGYPAPRPYNARIGSFSHLDEQNMPIIIGGASDYPLELDWIRVWTASDEPLLRQNVDE